MAAPEKKQKNEALQNLAHDVSRLEVLLEKCPEVPEHTRKLIMKLVEDKDGIAKKAWRVGYLYGWYTCLRRNRRVM